MAAPRNESPHPAAIGPYQVVRELGRGGMGTVYAAEDPHLRRPVALKVMAPAIASRPESRKRFLREARAMAAVKHDHVATVYAAGEADGTAYLAMELLEGAPLNKWLAKNPTPKLGVAVRLAKEVARGLAAAHAKGVVHRDVKPGNIWLEAPKGRVKLLDFGLARPADDDTQITTGGTAVGTPAYMAPEQARGKPTDFRADLWSLGVLLFRMTSGRLPFEADSALAMVSALSADPVPPLGPLAPAAPPALVALVDRLLRKDPAERPASAAVVADELQAVERSLSSSGTAEATPAPPPLPSRNRRLPAVVAASVGLLVIGGGIAAWATRSRPTPPPEPPAATVPEVSVAPPAVAPVTPSPANTTPSLDAGWLARVSTLPPDDQTREVAAEVARRNPGLANAPRFETRDGRVVGFALDGGPALRDLSPVAALTWLETFRVTMPEPTADRGPWADLSPLGDTKLRTLELRRCPVADLSPLTRLPVESLTLIAAKADDLAAVATCPLREVVLTGTPIRDVAPLKAAPLATLDCAGTPVADLAPLAPTPLTALRCDADLARRSAGVFAAMPALKLVNGTDWRLAERFAAAADLPPTKALQSHTGPVACVAFNADGRRFASGGTDGVAVAYDTTSRAERQRVTVGRAVGTLVWRTHDTLLAYDGEGASVLINAETRSYGFTSTGTSRWTAYGVAPDGAFAVSAMRFSRDGGTVLTRHSLPSMNGVMFTQPDGSVVHAIAFDADTPRFATASTGPGGGVRVWDAAAGQPSLVRALAAGAAATAVTYGPDGRLLVARDDSTLAAYDDADQPELTVSLPFRPRGLAAGPAGVLVCGDGNHAYLLDLATLAPVRRLTNVGKAGAAALSPDGLTLAVAADDGRVHIGVTGDPPPADGQPIPPFDPAWAARVATLAAAEQQREVTAEIARRNPGYLRVPKFEVRDDKVVGIVLSGNRHLRDLAPVAALTALQSFSCVMPENIVKGPWNDLTPLTGLPLHTVTIRGTRVTKLDALRGAPLKDLDCRDTAVSDLTPVMGRTMERLDCPPLAVNSLPRDRRNTFGMPALRALNGRPTFRDRFADRPALEPLATLAVGDGAANHVAFSPDGRQLAIGGHTALAFWDVTTRTRRHATPITGSVVGLGWADNVTVVVGRSFSPPAIHSAATGKETGVFALGGVNSFSTLVVSPDRKVVLVGTQAERSEVVSITRWGMTTRVAQPALTGIYPIPTRIAVRADGRLTAAITQNDLGVWDTSAARPAFRPNVTAGSCVAFTAAGRLVVADNGRLTVYSEAFKPGATLETSHRTVTGIVPLPGNRLLVVGDQGDATIHDATTLTANTRLPGPAATDAAVTADGHTAAIAYTDGTVRLWTLPLAPQPPK